MRKLTGIIAAALLVAGLAVMGCEKGGQTPSQTPSSAPSQTPSSAPSTTQAAPGK